MKTTSYCCFSKGSSSSSTTEEKEKVFQIPIVDFSSFLSLEIRAHGDGNDGNDRDRNIHLTSAQQQTAREIDAANRKHGFVCLRNTGISKSTLGRTFLSTEELFGANDDDGADDKKNTTLVPIDPVTNVGYAGYGKEALNRRRGADMKEAFNVRNPNPNTNPKRDGSSSSNSSSHLGDFFRGTPDEFQKCSMELWDELKILGHRFAVCCAVALGFEQDYFCKTLVNMDLCTLRMLHYPPCDYESDDGDGDGDEGDGERGLDASSLSKPIRVGEHTDFGIFTFLFVRNFQDESSHGLQVKAVEGSDLNANTSQSQSNSKSKSNSNTTKEGEGELENLNFYREGWNDVVFDEETIQSIVDDESCAVIVNTGALMARWTNDIWRATAHRVVVPSAEAAASHRYSIAMFFDPDRETVCEVHPDLLEESGGVAKYGPIKSIDYLLMKLKEAQGVKG